MVHPIHQGEANHFISERQSRSTMNDGSFSSHLLDVVCSIPSPAAQVKVVDDGL
jgi:hypothetical protein